MIISTSIILSGNKSFMNKINLLGKKTLLMDIKINEKKVEYSIW